MQWLNAVQVGTIIDGHTGSERCSSDDVGSVSVLGRSPPALQLYSVTEVVCTQGVNRGLPAK